jgi:molybdate transport system permease protein
MSALLSSEDLQALLVTAKLAAITTLILLALGIPLAWWLSRGRGALAAVVRAVAALPLVLPPTVLGFYLLLVLGPRGPLGPVARLFGLPGLAFTFPGLVLGSVVYSLPFVVQPLEDAFAAVSRRALEAAATLRASPLDRFFTVALPTARRGVFTAALLGLAHTVGEFGVVLMIGGSIPGETKVLSVAIYEHVEAMDYARAHVLSAGLLILSFLLLLALQRWGRRGRPVLP